MMGCLKLLPKDRDAEVVSCSDVWSFDIVTEQYQGNEQVVDVGFVNREEDHGHILLEKQNTDEHEYMKTIETVLINVEDNVKENIDLSVQMMIIVAHLCGSFLDHFQLTLVDLDTPKEAIKEPKQDPTSQPVQTEWKKNQNKTYDSGH